MLLRPLVVVWSITALAVSAGADEPSEPADLLAARDQALKGERLAQQDRQAEAEPLFRSALPVLDRRLGSEHFDSAKTAANLAEVLRVLDRPAEAVPLFRRAIPALERALGPEHRVVGLIQFGLARSYFVLRHADAIPALERALANLEVSLGPAHPRVVVLLEMLAAAHAGAGHAADAERFQARARTASEQALKEQASAEVVERLRRADSALHEGRDPDAESLMDEALTIAQEGFGPQDPRTALCLAIRSLAQKRQGRFDEAEAGYRRALDVYAAAVGPDSPEAARVLSDLSELMRVQRRPEAIELGERALAIREKRLPHDDLALAVSLNNLGLAYTEAGRPRDAEAHLRRALGIRERALGDHDDQVAVTLTNLALALMAQARGTEAEPLLLRSLAIHETAHGSQHLTVAQTVNDLGVLYLSQAKLDRADTMFARSLAIREKVLGRGHPDRARAVANLAALREAQGRHGEALALGRRAAGIAAGRLQTIDPERSEAGAREQQAGRELFAEHAARLARVVASPATSAAARRDALEESFQVAQLAHVRTAALALSRMVARVAAGTDALGRLVRERQEVLARLRQRDAFLLELAMNPPRSPAGKDALYETITKARRGDEEQLASLDERLAKESPHYAVLANPTPVGLAEARAVLGSDEALLVYLVGPKGTLLWVLRRDRAELVPLKTTSDDLEGRVRRLRAGLDPHSPFARGVRPAGEAASGFDARLAHELHRDVLAPAERYLEGARKLVLVLDGPLQYLPFGVLVTAPPPAVWDPRKVSWLVSTRATALLPSVSALPALRRVARSSAGHSAFVGFGDPDLGAVGADRGSSPPRPSRPDPADLRKLPPLPETAGELLAIAAALEVPKDVVHLGPQATKAALRSLPLSQYRVLAFSTHAVMAGEFPGVTEPALVLSPTPGEAKADDAFLTASEIARLSLDADWVVLAACNTAAPDGTADGESLSGLARSFFHAGARALLVSHWSVDSAATQVLVTRLFEAWATPKAARRAASVGRAEALQRAMTTMIQAGGRLAEPSSWGPFVLVGDGR